MTKADAYESLKELVKALDNTFWSSWQSTYTFQKELDSARQLIDELEKAE